MFLIVARGLFFEQLRDQKQPGENRAQRENGVEDVIAFSVDQPAVDGETHDEADHREHEESLRHFSHNSIWRRFNQASRGGAIDSLTEVKRQGEPGSAFFCLYSRKN